MIPEIHIEEYNYILPDDKIAKYPLSERDSSKLLRYINGNIIEYKFFDLPELIDNNSVIIFNETKVVPARLFFKRDTGAVIEIFCLEPVFPEEYNLMFTQKHTCRWKCIVGNAKKWKGDVLSLINVENDKLISEIDLKAHLVSREGQTAVVEFSWNPNFEFSCVLENCGKIPIPPYLNRDTESIDYQRYQTLYAKYRGSVAAPTAGLHFTDKVLNQLKDKGISLEKVCLHVGAGTFLPVKDSLISRHKMHREPFVLKLAFLENLLNIENNKKHIVAVGTTSVRTLESLYYLGVHCIENGMASDVEQWEPYTREYTYSTEEALNAIINYMKNAHIEELQLGTSIIIVPGFKFRIVDKLITNFHQPQSTLLLLISAFVAQDWKRIYDYALTHDFRFLSYGDSSCLDRVDL